jgi:hypothetical protein
VGGRVRLNTSSAWKCKRNETETLPVSRFLFTWLEFTVAGYVDISNVRRNSEAKEKFVLHRKLMELVAWRGEVENTNCTQAIYYSSLFVKLNISSLGLCRPFSLLRKNKTNNEPRCQGNTEGDRNHKWTTGQNFLLGIYFRSILPSISANTWVTKRKKWENEI